MTLNLSSKEILCIILMSLFIPDACSELEELIPQIVSATKDALMNPGDKEKQKRLDDLLDRAKAANKVIADAADQLRSKDKQISKLLVTLF